MVFVLARLARPLGFLWVQLLGILHYAYLTRAACLGLIAVLGLPLLASGPLRTLILGAYDVLSFGGACLIGVSLVITVGCLIHQRKLVDMHGEERFGAPIAKLRRGMTGAWNVVAFAAVFLNAITVLRASEQEHFGALLGGLLLGGVSAQAARMALRRMESRLADMRHGFPARVLSFLVSNGLRPSPGFVEKRNKLVAFSPSNVTLADGHLSALVYGTILVSIFVVVSDHHIHPLASLLLLICVLSLLLSLASFILDRYRLPLMLGILAYCGFMNLWRESDHYYPITPRPLSAKPLPTPAEIIGKTVAEARPLVVVTAAGGGIQSAAWTTRVLQQLEEQMTAVGSPGFHDSVRLISGVSGGSVGALQYVHALDGDIANPPLEQAARAASASSLSAAVVGLVKKDLIRATMPLLFTRSGALFEDRARTLEQAWSRNAEGQHGRGLEKVTLQQWAEGAAELRMPALIFNTTVVETGERMAISTAPRRPLGFLQPDRRGSFEFSERYIADISMLTAARLSATFPLVSPTARPAIADRKGGGLILPGTAHRGVFPRGGSMHHVVDGGYFENSGLVGALEWLDEAFTDLHLAGRPLPSRVLVIELSAFPEPPEDLMRLRPVDLGKTSRGTLYDLLSPALTMMNVRNSSQSAFAGQLLAQFSLRWQLQLKGKDNQPLVVGHLKVRPKPLAQTESTNRRGLLRRLEDWFFIPADMMHAPLSWHLRAGEIRQIDASAKLAVRDMLQTDAMRPLTATMAQQPDLLPPPAMPSAAAAQPLPLQSKPSKLSNRELLRSFITPKRAKP